MIFTINFWSFVISILAFLAAIYAIVYTHIQNKTILLISNGFYDKREQDPFILGFTVKNLSSKPLKLTHLTMKDEKNNELILIKDFTPTATFSVGNSRFSIPTQDIIGDYWYGAPLSRTELLQPNSELEFKYYVETRPPNYIDVILNFETFGFFKNVKTKKLSVVLTNQENKD
ncbi:hypothetical protein [Brochothrix thermosphacta]|uniref:Uncharacterized protein n=1 Tax=Brochothrix thermosphacta TaxID=2756 RepID=A0A2X0S901_BROTH|nr:hypothetical protein [Brochothrix thermosphacta]SPP28431.1 conserved hypothetical protein [Brochothrix thermosphacta]